MRNRKTALKLLLIVPIMGLAIIALASWPQDKTPDQFPVEILIK